MAFGSIVTAMPTMAPYDCPNSLICKDNGKCAGTEIACTPPPPEPEIKQVRPDAVRPTAPYKCSDKTICRENGKCGNGDACTPPIPDLVIEQAKPGPMRDPATVCFSPFVFLFSLLFFVFQRDALTRVSSVHPRSLRARPRNAVLRLLQLERKLRERLACVGFIRQAILRAVLVLCIQLF